MARIGAGRQKAIETTEMEISEDETAPRNNAGSDNEGSVDPEVGNNAQAAMATNGAISSSSSTAREEGTPAADNSSRRRSGRVVRPPRKLADELPTQSAPAKRKRAVVDQAEDDEEVADASGADNESNGDEEEDEEEGEEESSGEDDDEPDEEELREKKKAPKRRGPAKKAALPKPKAPAVKKARTASGAVAVPVKRTKKPAGVNGAGPKSAAGRRRKGKQRARERPAGEGGDADSILFDAVMDADNLSLVAGDWTIKYQEDGPEAMKQLVNFFLRCCGCEQSVTSYDIEDQDTAAATLSQIQEVFQKAQSPDYPIISKRPEFRGFRKTLSNFLYSVLEHITAKELLYTDPALIENIQIWIIAMSSSTLRPFRHTSTIISFIILTTLCDTASELRKSIVNATRQLEAESKKNKKNQGRIKALEEKISEGEERRDAVEAVIKDIFDAVFVHRYRDIDPKIRTDCVHELATWILKLPDMFFDGQYLRYLGWVLSDTSALTRAEVIKSLSRIFKNKNNISGMRNFTERFRPRLVEMATRDADSSVRAMTVELLDIVREVGFLESNDVDTIGRLLFDSDARVRKAVVGFFVKNIEDMYEEKIEELGGKEVVDEGMAGIDESDEDYSGPRVSWVKLKCLVEALAAYDEGSEDGGESGAESQCVTGAGERLGAIVREGAVESRFSLAGAVLWESFADVQAWEGIAKYLLFDHSAAQVEDEDEEGGTVEERIRRACALDAKEEVILLQVLNASVAATIVAGESTTAAHPKKTHRKRKPEGTSKEEVSRSLSKLIPPLLRKFGPVPDAASTVLRLEQLMKLDVYSDLRQPAAYASLLDDINRQFLTHADESVLKEASAALLHAKSFEELDEVTGEKLGQLQEETVAVLMACVRGRDVATQKLGDGVVTELINTVRRMEYLASITDVREMLETVPSAQIASAKRKGKQAENEDTGTKLPVEVLLTLLNRGTSMDELEEELIVRVLKVLLFYFMWKVKALSEEDPKDITDVDVDDLHERRQEMVMAIARIITSRSVGEGKTDGMDAVRIAAAGTLLDEYTLFATLQSRIDSPKATANKGEEAAESASRAEALERLVAFSKEMPEDLQSSVLKVFSKAERKFAKAAGKQLEESADNTSSDSDESESETSDNEEVEEEEAESSTLLTYEQRLCEFSAKIVLAVLGDVVEKERFVKRVARNEKRLGKNFADVVAHLTLAAATEEDHHAKKGGKRAVKGVQKRGRGATEVSEEEVEEGEMDMEDRIVVNKGDGDDEQEQEHDDEDHEHEHEHAEEEDGEGEGGEESEEHEHEQEDADVVSEQEDQDGNEEEEEEEKSLTPIRSPSLVIEDEDEEMIDA
ncbi:hypothetical protein EV426DRAFT_610370 [Tirmania nivea]|nr:hypothetical protein EV426DRAFT_610370 [Tirmania nivea]